MSNTFRKIRQAEKEGLKIPKSVQQAIPSRKCMRMAFLKWGIIFSKTMRFTDINYRVASTDDQMDMFLKYCDLINSIDSEAVTKITINNRRFKQKGF